MGLHYIFTSLVRMGECIHGRKFLYLWLVNIKYRRFNPEKERPVPTGIHWLGGCVCQRTGMNDMEKWKFLSLPGIELWSVDRTTRRQSLYRMHYSRSSLKVHISEFIIVQILIIIFLTTLRTKWHIQFCQRKLLIFLFFVYSQLYATYSTQ
jgi:hypothetical protein